MFFKKPGLNRRVFSWPSPILHSDLLFWHNKLMGGWQYDFRKLFNRLQKDLPDLTRNASFVGGGGFGMIIGHTDNTVSKILYRPHDNPEALEHALRNFYRETQALTLLAGVPVEGVDIPVLVDDPREIYHPNYIGVYRMTRLAGTMKPYLAPENATQVDIADYQTFYESAGALLGSFHKAARALPFPENAYAKEYEVSSIDTLAVLSDRTNRALEIADRYLQTHKIEGVAHGDFGTQNYLTNGGMVTGLLDFSFTHRSPNIMIDFWNTPEGYISEFNRGYERAAGLKIDTCLLAASNLSMHVHLMKRDADSPEKYVQRLAHINRELNNLIPVTSLKP